MCRGTRRPNPSDVDLVQRPEVGQAKRLGVMGQTALLPPAVFTCQSPLLDCLPEGRPQQDGQVI